MMSSRQKKKNLNANGIKTKSIEPMETTAAAAAAAPTITTEHNIHQPDSDNAKKDKNEGQVSNT